MSIPALQFERVGFSYPGGFRALQDVSFDLYDGEKVALVGLNGSGKSTLLLHADALLFATEGRVMFRGVEVSPRNAAECRKEVGMVFQDSDDQLFMPTVEADVAFGPRNMGLSKEEVRMRVDKALEMTRCGHLRDRAPFRLSGGQRKMVSVATVLSMMPDVLVFDEPTCGLDYAARGQFIDIVGRLPHTILMASHDMDLVRSMCSRALVMDNGRLVYDGPVEHMPFPNDIKLQS